MFKLTKHGIRISDKKGNCSGCPHNDNSCNKQCCVIDWEDVLSLLLLAGVCVSAIVVMLKPMFE